MSAFNDRFHNKETAFTVEERRNLKISGLLPAKIEDISLQEKRVLFNLRSKKSELEKYIFLRQLQDMNETLFFHIAVRNMEEIMPIIYTPTVGAACENFSYIYQKPRGLYVSAEDKGRVGELIRNYPENDIRVIVVTDGERILGLGDLGANGMGIPIGKLSLYTACAGVRPDFCLPVTLDVGTNTEKYLSDPLYIGLQRKRLAGKEYLDLVDEFIQESTKRYPGVLIQFEDFGNTNAFILLEKYKNEICCFNDDIQGTASVAFSGILSSLRLTGKKLEDQKFLFLGAGEAALGIANLIVFGLVQKGIDREVAKKLCWFVDSTGLVENTRKNLSHEKKDYSHEHAPITELIDAVRALKPTALIGVSGQPKKFTKEIVESMSEYNDRPIIFALSNPTHKAECSAEEAYVWSQGKAIFCSGSPFPPVSLQDGRTLVSGQGNNSYIFPAVGFAAIHTKATRITDEMFYIAAQALSSQVTEHDLVKGCVYPPLSNIREVSFNIAIEVAELIFKRGLAGIGRPSNLIEFLRSNTYEPVYQPSACL